MIPGLVALASVVATPSVALAPVVTGLDRPVHVTTAPGDPGALYVVEQAGRVRVVEDGALRAAPFLDVRHLVSTGHPEEGLLGLAFHPRYAENRRFFVAFTRVTDGARFDVVMALTAAPAPARAAALDGAYDVLAIADPAGNHNGGTIAFGPDGYLYVGTGDGGGANDRFGTSRDPKSLLAKMLRLDVDRARPYAIPDDNPFARDPARRPEIWATGLRNPWRFSFDRETGDLWIADVGQNAFEEIHMQPRASRGGEDYGWNVVEGRACFSPPQGCVTKGLTPPVHVYGHDEGCSVTGGVVVRGRALPELTGGYVFSDYCSGKISLLRRDPRGAVVVSTLVESGRRVSAFGEDAHGEVLVVDHGGAILRLVPIATAR